jgi:pimeloyl-ACP methyl ester carboxylesterase
MGATVDAFRAIARAREPDDIADRVAEVKVPVLLLLGGAKHSAGPPRDEVRMLVAGLVALSIDTVPGAGHHLAEERPDRVVAALIGSERVAARLEVP